MRKKDYKSFSHLTSRHSSKVVTICLCSVPLILILNELFSIKFLQPFYFIINSGKGKKVNCCLINYFQLLFLIKCMASLLCEGGCRDSAVLPAETHSLSLTLSHPRIFKKHDAENHNKGKLGKNLYFSTQRQTL